MKFHIKPVGADSCRAWSSHKKKATDACPAEDGQQNSSGLCEQARGHKVQTIAKRGKEPVEILFAEQNHDYCRMPDGQSELQGGPGEPGV